MTSINTWEEVKQLAADFQKAQLTSAVQRLSERNCVEVINKLISLGLVDVLYTIDGKEYITHKHLSREIVDELIEQGGKVNLTDLVQTLNVDYSHIEARIYDVVKHNPGIKFVNGQVLNKSYIDNLALEVNELLQRNGQIYIPDLVKQFDLPGDFLHEQISLRVGTLIDGRFDKDDHSCLFTDDYVLQTKARICGVLSAATRPVSVSSLIGRYGFPERQFFVITDELLAVKRISGSVVGGRQALKATFIPAIYLQMQQDWVDNFYKQNGYLEYASLRRMGIGEPENYVRKRLVGDVIFLSDCVVGNEIAAQVEACVEDALLSHQFVDIVPLLPPALSSEDAAQLLKILVKKIAKSGEKELIFGETCVTNEKFIEELIKKFDEQIHKKAAVLVTLPSYHQLQFGGGAASKQAKTEVAGTKSKKEERRKRATEGKAGGGNTKTTKKKNLKGREESAEVASESRKPIAVQFLSFNELVKELNKEEVLKDLPNDIVEDLASYLQKLLNAKLEEAYEALLSQSSGNRKQTITEILDMILRKYDNFKHYAKALKAIPNVTLQVQLDKFLVKTYGGELFNNVIQYCTVDSLMNVDLNRELINDQRQKVINELPEDVKSILLPFQQSLGTKSAADFSKDLEPVLNGIGIVLKKNDKKKNVMQVFHEELVQQLNAAEDPALVLHLAVVLLFLKKKQEIIHISGRFVPQILECIAEDLEEEEKKKLFDCQQLVMKRLTVKSEDPELETINTALEEVLPRVKEFSIASKKASSDSNKDTPLLKVEVLS